MNSTQRTFIVALGVAAATFACGAASARDGASTCPSVTHVQRRIVEKADQGIDSLRSYVQTTTFVYGIEMTDVKASIDDWRAAVTCQAQVAAAAAQVQVASKGDQAAR